ncbi:hypothetical protein CJ195_21810 [Bacillus sp. UMB0899]|nr:hypothetical protein CJ195_21810 [Bacillus sp. UMB0899]
MKVEVKWRKWWVVSKGEKKSVTFLKLSQPLVHQHSSKISKIVKSFKPLVLLDSSHFLLNIR